MSLSEFKRGDVVYVVKSPEYPSPEDVPLGSCFVIEYVYVPRLMGVQVIIGPGGAHYFKENLAHEIEYNSPLYTELK